MNIVFNKTKELIVSAYNRDYEYWINLIKKDIKVIVYRKGSAIKNNEVYIANNIGRDVHTFFYHIYNSYYNLADYTFTSQDYPFDHVSNYIDVINGDENVYNENSRLTLNGCWFFNDCMYSNRRFIKSDKFGCPDHCGLKIEEVWNQLFDECIPNDIWFVPAGHFCITKEAVRIRPIDFYEKIINILENNPDAPWIIERLEPYIFNNNIKIK